MSCWVLIEGNSKRAMTASTMAPVIRNPGSYSPEIWQQSAATRTMVCGCFTGYLRSAYLSGAHALFSCLQTETNCRGSVPGSVRAMCPCVPGRSAAWCDLADFYATCGHVSKNCGAHRSGRHFGVCFVGAQHGLFGHIPVCHILSWSERISIGCGHQALAFQAGRNGALGQSVGRPCRIAAATGPSCSPPWWDQFRQVLTPAPIEGRGFALQSFFSPKSNQKGMIIPMEDTQRCEWNPDLADVQTV